MPDQPPAVRRYVADDPDASVYTPGQLVITTHVFDFHTRHVALGAYAETGRVRHANYHREPDRIAVRWNFSEGHGIDSRFLRAVKIVPEGTPGAVAAWVNGLPRYEVHCAVYDNRDGLMGHRLAGFTDDPERYEDDEYYVDRFQIRGGLHSDPTCPALRPDPHGWKDRWGCICPRPCACDCHRHTFGDGEPPF